jgi:LmbE family N-acetylglucosaminyl deacetylase
MASDLRDASGLSILAAFAHPDDEGFGCGGVLAALVARGARITLVCATNGDVGEISDPSLATPETLPQVRQEELRQAMAITGVQDLRFLNYRDSGMAGTEENNHPRSLWQASADEVVGRLVDIIREVRPQLLITHDPSGGYGHPDHRATYRHVTEAYSQAGRGAGKGQEARWKPEALYYVCFPRREFRRMWQQMRDLGITPPFASMETDNLGSPDEAVTTTLDIGHFLDAKIASLNCHRTQLDPNGAFAQLPEEVMRDNMRREFFTLALPQGGGEEADLLARLIPSSGQ